MNLVSILEICNYVLVLIFGLFLSVGITGGWENRQQKRMTFILCLVFLLIQAFCWLLWDTEAVRMLYPLIVHMPLVLILVFALNKRPGSAVVSVCIGYLCCQLPRWILLIVSALTGSHLAGEIAYTLAIIPIFFLLQRWFVQPAHEAMAASRQSLLLFGSLPAAYYLFDYVTTVYAHILQPDLQALNEFLPTALILFYVIFLTAYHTVTRNHAQIQLQSTLLEAKLKQTQSEMENLRRAEIQTAIYQHDIRHHMVVLEGFLDNGQSEQAVAYIHQVESDLETITPKQYCKNQLVNLLCSSFAEKAAQAKVQLQVEARLPEDLPISDTELCSLLSNGLENALKAASGLEPSRRWVKLYCGIRLNKLLIELCNPYGGDLIMRDGFPVTDREGHGYGCRSILAITRQHHGICTFEPENGIFTLRVVLPVI